MQLLWDIPCTVEDLGPVTFRVSGFGHVVAVEPPSSPFRVDPLDVDGFAPVGTLLFVGDRPPLAIDDVLRDGTEVTGLAVVLRTNIVFVSAAIVDRPLRMITPPPSSSVSPAIPENEWELGEWYQQVTDGVRDPDDDQEVGTTRRQALKLAAIVEAAIHNPLYVDALHDVSDFLEATAADRYVSSPQAPKWERVEKWPWPRKPER